MKKSDLKQLIKPLVKECIHEVLIEEGLLSNVVSEVAKGMQATVIMERASPPVRVAEHAATVRDNGSVREKINEHRTKLMESINSDAYNGIDLFEGTDPMSNHEAATPKGGAVDLGNPRDSGVDISAWTGNASKIWKAIK
jgi:hypothetical protein